MRLILSVISGILLCSALHAQDFDFKNLLAKGSTYIAEHGQVSQGYGIDLKKNSGALTYQSLAIFHLGNTNLVETLNISTSEFNSNNHGEVAQIGASYTIRLLDCTKLDRFLCFDLSELHGGLFVGLPYTEIIKAGQCNWKATTLGVSLSFKLK